MVVKRPAVPWVAFRDTAKVGEILAAPAAVAAPALVRASEDLDPPTVERFEPEQHLAMISTWTPGGMTAEFLPPTGFVVDRTAAAFLLRTDGRVCLVDSIMVDPVASETGRSRAVARLLVELRAEARRLGFQRLVCTVSFSGPAALLRAGGFVVHEHTYLGVAEL